MKTLRILAVIMAMTLFGILGVAVVIAKWGEQVETEPPKIETASSTHYHMPSFLPQAIR